MVLAVPYLILLPYSAQQRIYPLRKMFNGLCFECFASEWSRLVYPSLGGFAATLWDG